MKTIDTPYSIFTDYEVLYKAYQKASATRHKKIPVAQFEKNTLCNIEELREELINETYRQGKFHRFYVQEPKKREIQAIPFRDRIVMHVMCDEVLNPYFEKRVIYDNCGCIHGRGQHFAVKRLKHFLHCAYNRWGEDFYVLKCDILKYFPSLSHEVIKKMVSAKITDYKVRKLFNHIVDAYETPKQFLVDNGIPTDTKRGVPIGNQTSQILGYYYLDPLDRYIKHTLKMKYYIRYMDDFLIIHNDKRELQRILCDIRCRLRNALKLEFNRKTQISPIRKNVKFLGIHFHVHSGHVTTKVQDGVITRFRRQIAAANKHPDSVDKAHLRSVVASYHGCFKHTSSRGRANQIKKELNVSIVPEKEKPLDIYDEIYVQ
jgi:hypothetical protein